MDPVEQRGRHRHVRVDEDEQITRGMARTGVARPRDVPHRFVNHCRAVPPGDGGGLVLAVVVDDDHLDVSVDIDIGVGVCA